MANRRPPLDTLVRVNFQVAHSVNPLLASDLKRFTLGRSRHARLLTLAMIGLLSETRTLNGDVVGGSQSQGRKDESAEALPTEPRLNGQDFAEIGEW